MYQYILNVTWLITVADLGEWPGIQTPPQSLILDKKIITEGRQTGIHTQKNWAFLSSKSGFATG